MPDPQEDQSAPKPVTGNELKQAYAVRRVRLGEMGAMLLGEAFDGLARNLLALKDPEATGIPALRADALFYAQIAGYLQAGTTLTSDSAAIAQALVDSSKEDQETIA